ncbi:hypothetical protein U1Q18_032705, partial [Sarracenia purpurea var. burkii]
MRDANMRIEKGIYPLVRSSDLKAESVDPLKHAHKASKSKAEFDVNFNSEDVCPPKVFSQVNGSSIASRGATRVSGGNDNVRFDSIHNTELAVHIKDGASGNKKGEIREVDASSENIDSDIGFEVEVKTSEKSRAHATGDKVLSDLGENICSPSVVLEGEDAEINEKKDADSPVGDERKVENASEVYSAEKSTEENEKGKLGSDAFDQVRDGTESLGNQYQVLYHLEDEGIEVSPDSPKVAHTQYSSHDSRDLVNEGFEALKLAKEGRSILTKEELFAIEQWLIECGFQAQVNDLKKVSHTVRSSVSAENHLVSTETNPVLRSAISEVGVGEGDASKGASKGKGYGSLLIRSTPDVSEVPEIALDEEVDSVSESGEEGSVFETEGSEQGCPSPPAFRSSLRENKGIGVVSEMDGEGVVAVKVPGVSLMPQVEKVKFFHVGSKFPDCNQSVDAFSAVCPKGIDNPSIMDKQSEESNGIFRVAPQVFDNMPRPRSVTVLNGNVAQVGGEAHDFDKGSLTVEDGAFSLGHVQGFFHPPGFLKTGDEGMPIIHQALGSSAKPLGVADGNPEIAKRDGSGDVRK